MRRRVAEWLGRVPTEDPFERRSAVIVQIFCIGLAVLLGVTELSRVGQLGSMPPSELYSVFANWGSAAASLAAVVLIRRGRVRQGFVVVLGSYLAILTVSLLLRGLGYHQHLIVRVFGILLVLPALLLGRRALWTAFAVLVAAMLAGHVRDTTWGALPPSVPPLGIWGQIAAVMLLFAVILDRFGAALREAYAEARLRQEQAEKASQGLIDANRALSEEIERRVQAEALLFQSQKLEAIGRLSGGIAHDVNNVLTAVIGYAQLARDQLPDGSPVVEDLDGIVDAAQRAGGLTRNLLAFARRQIVEPKVLTIESRLDALRGMVRRIVGESLRVELRLADVAWPVYIDPVQLDQVVVNLAVNARDTCPNGGTLTLETAHVVVTPTDEVVALGLTPGEYVRLSVTDTGAGMDANALENAFEPFFTTKEQGKGTGLGLATSYGIVRQAGGAMRVRSQVGHGTTFDVFLPRTTEVADVPSRPASAAPQSGTETILIVEDDPRVLRVAQRTLESQGYRVLTARAPEQALTVSAEHRGEIALLVTDVVLPQMNGRVMAERIREKRPGTSVLYASGYSHDVIAHHGVLDPELMFLPKPFTPDELTAKVRQVLDGRDESGSRGSGEVRTAG